MSIKAVLVLFAVTLTEPAIEMAPVAETKLTALMSPEPVIPNFALVARPLPALTSPEPMTVIFQLADPDLAKLQITRPGRLARGYGVGMGISATPSITSQSPYSMRWPWLGSAGSLIGWA